VEFLRVGVERFENYQAVYCPLILILLGMVYCDWAQARRFLTRWSFYSSIVIRDLTLRSAQRFVSLHNPVFETMRLLFWLSSR